MKSILLVAALAVVSASPQYDAYSESDSYEPFDPPKYEFEYSVKDAASVNDYGQREERDGPSTAGSYEVRLPDTRLQRVVYTVDGDSGFIADVEFDGEAQHPAEYDSSAGGSGYAAPAQSYTPSYPEPARPAYEPAEPAATYRPAPSPPKVSYRPAPSPPRTSYRPAPSPPKESYRPTTTTPKPTYRPATSPPRVSYRPTPSAPKTSYGPAPSPPKTTYRPAPSPPKVSYRPKTSYRPAPTQAAIEYSPTSEPTTTTTTTEPSVYGNKKLKFARVPSDVYDKPLFRSDYERAVGSRSGGSRKKKQPAPARYGPSAVLIGSDDDRYLVPGTPGLQKLLAAPWVSYKKAVDSYLAKEDLADDGEGAGKVTYAGGRDGDHPAEDSHGAASSAVPFGARISQN
ncbi:adhesive plaque matrix protein-like [Amphibalanus amphitrite]|uniref:adhesive plaque matrix protein-like n=1 Tax=Amphibalanus amphitrite TaxID=1232801 RepID=UPI001C928F48|nr:adhesive plaque matrix protein-like [Amphibalanus amphitrite]